MVCIPACIVIVFSVSVQLHLLSGMVRDALHGALRRLQECRSGPVCARHVYRCRPAHSWTGNRSPNKSSPASHWSHKHHDEQKQQQINMMFPYDLIWHCAPKTISIFQALFWKIWTHSRILQAQTAGVTLQVATLLIALL